VRTCSKRKRRGLTWESSRQRQDRRPATARSGSGGARHVRGKKWREGRCRADLGTAKGPKARGSARWWRTREAAWKGGLRGRCVARLNAPACLHPAYGTATGGVSVVHPWVDNDELNESVRQKTVGTPRRCANLRICTRVHQSAVTTSPGSSLIPFRPFRNCKTPKIVNKLENLQKAKL
jgi:hypothetical protein